MTRLGVFGSSFNPPTLAHAVLLAEARWQLALDRIMVVPTGEAWHKDISGAPAAGVRMALANTDMPVARRLALADDLFGSRVSPETALFVRRAVLSLDRRSLTSSLSAAGRRAAERRRRLTATVVAAAPLTRAQVDRLEAILERAYGRHVAVNVAVDPAVVGGLRIQVGSEVVDATVLARLDEARRRLAG